MFKLHRNRSDRLGERFEFRFSDFRAVQVPVVADRLFLSIVSVDTGKTVAKTSKAAARNGSCQWPDSILEPILFCKDEVSKEIEECQCKIVVSVGSAKSSIIGEVFLNLTNYLGSVDSTAISLPLKRCNSGTVLQLKIQCLGTKSKLSGVKSWNEISPRLHSHSPTNDDDMDSKSDGSDNMFNRSVQSLSGNHLGSTYQDEPGNRDASFSASGSHRSSNSGDSALDRTNISPRDNSNGGFYIGRQDSATSYVSNVSAGRGDDVYRSNNSSFSSRTSGPNMLQGNTTQAFASGLAQLSLGTSDSSKDLLEAAEETIEELRDEAKMWERHSRKLKADLEMLKKECSDKSKQYAELAVELSAARVERDSFRQEVEELRSSLEELTAQHTIPGTPKYGDTIDLQKELNDEVTFLRESNANLTTQLKKTQEANIELVSILQELEETIEVQRAEISKLSQANDVIGHEDSKSGLSAEEEREWPRKLSLKDDEITMLREKLDRILNIENAGGEGCGAVYLELEKENDFLKVKIQELEKDCSELTDENLELIFKLKAVSGVTKRQGPCVSDGNESEIEMLTSRIQQLEEELRSKEMLDTGDFAGASAANIKDLERKCTDLELKVLNFRSGACELEEKLQKSQEELYNRNVELSELREKLVSFHTMEMDSGETSSTRGFQLRSKELENTESEIDVLKAGILLKEQEIDALRHSRTELEKFVSEIRNEKSQLEENLSASLKESSITSKCLDEVRQDLVVLTSSIDSYVSANKVLERKVAELEGCKAELQLHVSELEHENVELSQSKYGLEAQMTCLTNEQESSKLGIDDSQSLIMNLKDKVEQQQLEIESQKVDIEQKQQEAQRRLSEALEDTEVLRRSNSKLQSRVESLIEECSSLQTLTADLRKQKSELHGHVIPLEQELESSIRRSFDLCETVEFLEAKLSSLQKDVSLREQSLLSELESIFHEHKEHEESIYRAHFLLNKIEKEKTLEVENLEREVVSLTAQVSSTHDERENATLDAIREASVLRTDKAKLEANLQDANAQMRHYESQLENLRNESSSKIISLVESLNASKQSEEMLTTDVEHMKRLMETTKSNEGKFRKISGQLELKLKSSDYEKQQRMEEISGLKIQVQKITNLQDEVFKLQSSLDEAKFEKGKLEELLQSVSEKCEEMKAEKSMLTEKVSYLEDSLRNGEEEKRSMLAMQAKLVRLESDLSTKEASLHVHEAELTNELSRIKRENSEYQRKIQSLEQEKEDLARRTQLMEKELELKMAQIKEENITKQGNIDLANDNGSSPVNEEPDLHSKIQLLETKLAEVLEENEKCRAQQKSPTPEWQSGSRDDKETNDDKIPQLEAELKDMKDRLLNMSMQYAEVEAQREQLVMELKTVKKGRWF